jgi:hypothetical protein
MASENMEEAKKRFGSNLKRICGCNDKGVDREIAKAVRESVETGWNLIDVLEEQQRFPEEIVL